MQDGWAIRPSVGSVEIFHAGRPGQECSAKRISDGAAGGRAEDERSICILKKSQRLTRVRSFTTMLPRPLPAAFLVERHSLLLIGQSCRLMLAERACHRVTRRYWRVRFARPLFLLTL
jgi:hypothetical protein